MPFTPEILITRNVRPSPPHATPALRAKLLPTHRPRRAPTRAFTLIELLVVISIVIILVAVSVPVLKVLGTGNAQAQAVNELSMLFSNARAKAVQTHNLAGVVIYEDPNARGQSDAQLIVCSASDGKTNYFIREPQTAAEALPVGIKIATIDDTKIDDTTPKGFKSQVTFGSPPPTPPCRLILFDANGQLTTRNNLETDLSLSSDTSAKAWNLSSATGSPGLVIYNDVDLQAARDSNTVTDPASLQMWLQNHANLLIVNPYTGGLIQ